MAKGKKRKKPYTGVPTRQQRLEQQQRRELQEANRGFVGLTTDEIRENIAREFEAEAPENNISDSVNAFQKTYILDTNLILSCINVLYNPDDPNWKKPRGFKPSLENAHLVIPYIVFEELNHLKSEISHRGMIAREAFSILVKFFPNSGRTLDEILHLKAPIPTGWGTQTISILPLHRNFSKILPYVPERDDNDGWVAVTALAATMLAEGLPIDGTLGATDELGGETIVDILARSNAKRNVILLTNDKSLLSKADLFGVRVRSYSFEKPKPFTGCRELIVPPEMFKKFYDEERLSREDFEHFLPDEPPLVANEYVTLKLENEWEYPRNYFDDDGVYFKNVVRFHKRKEDDPPTKKEFLYPLRFMKYEGKEPKNAGIAAYYDALNDDKIHVINVTGAAGTGKTYQAITHAIRAVKNGEYMQVVLIPSQSAKNPLGALPGNKEQKVEPLVAAAKDAIRSYVANQPEFKEKRNVLRKFGDNDRDNSLEEEVTQDERQKKGSRDRRDDRSSRRTFGDYTGSFDDLDFGTNDYAFSGRRNGGHSKKKKDKTFYPGNSEKKQSSGSEGKMTYREALEKRVNYLFNRYFVCIPYEEAQGQSPEDSFIIIDEAQRTRVGDADTLISRPARGSKLVICGDTAQIRDSSAEKQFNNALIYSMMLFNDWEGCANIHLTENLRSDIAEVMARNRAEVRRKMGLLF